MKVFVLDNGRLENDFAQIVNLSGIATADNKNPRSNWIEQPVYSVLIEHPEGLILFDAACHPEAMSNRWTKANKNSGPYVISHKDQLLPETLKKMGISFSDIRYVVVSHLHEDHAGCLEYFKNSQIIVNDFEFAMTMRLYGLGGEMGAYIKKDIEAWINAKLDWRLITSKEDNIKLVNRITILNFGSGHTFGMLGLLIELENTSNIILASDTIFTSTNLGPPIRYPAVVYDSIGYMDTIIRIANLAKEKNAQIWFGHDKKQFDTLRKYPNGYYDA